MLNISRLLIVFLLNNLLILNSEQSSRSCQTISGIYRSSLRQCEIFFASGFHIDLKGWFLAVVRNKSKVNKINNKIEHNQEYADRLF